MIKRTAVVSGWLIAAHAIWAGLYWLLLQVPESNVLMLGTSLLLVVALVWWLGVAQGVGLLYSAPGGTLRGALLPALTRAWMIVLPLLVFGAVWILTAQLYAWLGTHSSEMDAWILLKTGWTKGYDVGRVLDHAIALVRWVVGLSLAVTLFWQMLRKNVSALLSFAWVRQSFHWPQLLVFAAALLLAALPAHHLLDWRWVPKDSIGTWVEPALVAVKLGVIYVAGSLVWACVLRWVARDPANADAPR